MRRAFWNANTHYHPVILDALPPGASRVLDVGCGDGILLADLLRAGVPHVVGLDVDRGVLDRARTRHAGLSIDWVHGDLSHRALQPGSFDGVVAVAALHQMNAGESLTRFAELVRPGGVVAVIGLAASDWWDIPAEGVGLVARYSLGAIYGMWKHSAPQTWPPPLTYREMKRLSAECCLACAIAVICLGGTHWSGPNRSNETGATRRGGSRRRECRASGV